MKSPSHAQSGLTLMELLIALAIATLLVAPLAAAVMNALKAQSVASDSSEVAQQAQFAMQRMEAAVRHTVPHTLDVKASDSTTYNWLAPVPLATVVTYCLRADKSLIETTLADTNCTSTSVPVIADSVSDFKVPPFTAVAGVGPVIVIQLTVTGATGQSISLTSRTRLGGGTL